MALAVNVEAGELLELFLWKKAEEVNKEKAYVNVVKKVKKDNVTPDNIGEIMLSQIPRISSVSALALISHFKNITNLINEIQKDSSCLEKVTYTTNKNQIKKIQKKARQKNILLILKAKILSNFFPFLG